MKKLFVLMVAMTMTMAASAQITWNVKLGGGFAICAGGANEGDMKARFVGKVGFGLEKPFSANFSLMPSVELALKGTKWSYRESGYSHDETYSPLYVQIPILGAYRFNLNDDWNLTLKVGPYFAYGISGGVDAKASYNGSSASGNRDLFSDLNAKRFDAGIDVGVDFEYHRFVFGLEYERGFVSFAPSNGYAKVNIYNQAVYATVGYKF